MWTAKRVLLLALGFALLFTFYLVYAHYLGGIDGLPPLPDSCQRSTSEPMARPGLRQNFVDERLEMAFGKACPEVSRIIRLEVHANGIVLSTDDFLIVREGPRTGQVRLQPFSVALFSKKTPPGQYPEISTIRCKTAYITFDRPIGNLNDMTKAKIVGAELVDDIHVVNNHRKPRSSNEELYVEVPKGPVFYQQRQHAANGAQTEPDIWTADILRLGDSQTKPFPTKIDAVGMRMFLASEAPAPAANPAVARKQRAETVSGVERVVLLSSVRMELYTDSRSGFLSTGENAGKPPPKAPPAAPADKTRIIIETPGTFFYDVQSDFAQFDVPPNGGEPSPHRVHVTRITKPAQHDQLYCERLELQFRRKKAGEDKSPPPAADRAVELEIETAHATGKDVTLASDAETLEVLEANDFLYDARTRATVVKGAGEIAVFKDGHELWARKLQIEERDGGQQMTADGPGRIGLFDKTTKKRSTTAAWNEKLISSKDRDQDLLTLTGGASFQDLEHDQHLQADEIKVWLEPAGRAPAQPAAAVGSSQGSRRPQRVEATGHVVTRSPDMTIHDTDKLILTFKDAPPGVQPPTGSAGSPTQGQRPVTPTAPNLDSPPRTGDANAGTGSANAKPDPAKPARPIQLSAHLAEARVLRLEGGKNELDRLWTEGQVHVVQAPEKPGEKGLDIKGDTLELVKQPEGNRLVVTGDLAELQTDKLVIRGPQIDVDQAENEAWVRGGGALTMRGDNGFNGNKLDHEVDMTIYWHEYMHFKGAHAQFTGDVQAEQENARLACLSLQVDLDRPISFREGQKSGPPAKVAHMVCDKSVTVEDSEFEKGRCVKFQRIECRELVVNNVEGTAQGIGPGTVRIHQKGDGGSPLSPGSNPAPSQVRPSATKQDQEMKLTIVNFGSRMWANNQTHVVIFSDDIEVIHFATEDKDAKPDLDHLPPDAIYLRCSDQLKLLNRPEGGKSNQELEGIGRVETRTKDYIAQCEKLTYHETKDQLIFHGGDGWAHMKRLGPPGTQGQEWEAKTIIYSRKTGEINSIKSRGVNGTTGP